MVSKIKPWVVFMLAFIMCFLGINTTVKAEKVALQPGKVYKADSNTYFKLLDNNKYFELYDNAKYKNEQQLESFRKTQENPSLYFPEFYLLEGTYSYESGKYKFYTKRETKITFKNVHNLKGKVYSEISQNDNANTSNEYWYIKKKGNNLCVNNGGIVKKSTRNISNSIENFLLDYTYKPEKLE